MPFMMKLTAAGAAKVAAAQAGGTAVTLTEFAVGDGDGAAVAAPTGAETELVNERWRGDISALAVKAGAPTIVVAEALLPSDVGGWTVHELGVFDDDGDLFAYGNFPATFKPLAVDGATREMIVKAELRVNSAANVELVIDPALVMATRAWCLSTFLQIDQNLADVADAAAALANLGGAPLASPEFTGNPRAPTPDPADNDTSIATTAFVRSITDALSDVPVGSTLPIAGVPDANWLKCDGSSYLQASYPELFTRIGTLPRLVWTERTVPAGVASVNKLIFLNGHFVTLGSAASTGGYYSADNGATWGAVTGNITGIWHDMCWTGEKYVLTGTNNVISNSPTLGAAFTARVSAFASNPLYGCASNGAGVVVAVGKYSSQARVQYSLDHGDTWTLGALPGVGNWDLTSVVYAEGRFVLACSDSANVQTRIYTSVDGINWVLTATLSGLVGNLAYTSGTFYAYVFTAFGYITVAKSADGLTWSGPSALDPFALSPTGLGSRIAVLPDGLLTFGNQTNLPAPLHYLHSDLRSVMHLRVPPRIIPTPGQAHVAYGNGVILMVHTGSPGFSYSAPLYDYSTGTEFIVPAIGPLNGTSNAPFYIRAS